MEANEAFEQEKLKVMQENYQVFDCSGTLEHEDDCDGNCEVVKLGELDIQIHEENQRWNDLGMIPLGSLRQAPRLPGVPVDTFHLEIAFNSLLNYLRDKGMADPEELDEYYRQERLKRMTIIREKNEEAILANRRRQSIAPGLEMPQIEVPEYIKRRMN